MGWDQLPTEIAVDIFYQVDRSSLISIRSVCSTWFDIINDYRFYHDIKVDSQYEPFRLVAPAPPDGGFSKYMLWYNKYIVFRFICGSELTLDFDDNYSMSMYNLCFYLDALRKADSSVRFVRMVEYLIMGFDIEGHDTAWELIYGQMQIACKYGGWNDAFSQFKEKYYSNSPAMLKYRYV